jgi:hypothetical protein
MAIDLIQPLLVPAFVDAGFSVENREKSVNFDGDAVKMT